MKTESIKALLDACYQAKRIRELLPALPDGVSPSFIQYLDVIEHLQRRNVCVKISDISDALNIPRPGATHTVKDMVNGALVLQAAYGAVDLLVVGRFGSTSGLSAVSTGSQVLNLVTFVVIQFAMGITVLIARYLGEKRPEEIGAVISGAVVVFTIISAVLFLAMVCLARPISVLMQAPAEAVDLTTDYVRICGSGIFFIVAYNLLSAIFRGLGDSQSPLLFVLVACIVMPM